MMKDCMPGFGVMFVLWVAVSVAVSVFKAATDNCTEVYPIDTWVKTDLLCS